MKETINILCATDDNYVPYCGIMLTSVFENNKDAVVNVFVIIDKPLTIANIAKFKELEKKYDASIQFLLIDTKLFEEWPLPENSHFTKAVYYRLAAAELIPHNVSRVLYLDCDIVVNAPLADLYDVNLSNNSTAVVDDMCSGINSNFSRLKYAPELRYFNSGMLLINLDYWRKHDIFSRFKNYVCYYRERILWPDQDVLNAVLLDSKLHVGIEWNYQMGFLKQSYFDILQSRIQKEVLSANPKIIHYNQSKPWCVAYYNLPYNREWHQYKRMSPWKNMNDTYPPHKKFNYFIKRWLLWPLGLMIKTDTIKR